MFYCSLNPWNLRGELTVTYSVPIERGKVREFARAAQAQSTAYAGETAIIPPTFLTTARLNWAPPQDNPSLALGFDRARVLHGEEEYVFHGPPPRVGQELSVSSRLGEQYERAGRRGGVMRFGVILTEFRDASGALVAEQRTTLIETAKAQDHA